MRLIEEPKSTFYEQYGKRVLDIIFAFSLLVFSTPIIIITIIIILLANGSPVFFKQKRVGQFGKEFIILKFRTMSGYQEVESLKIIAVDGVPEEFFYKQRKDNRVTKIGTFLRKYSIDELPQLYNVLLGDMSIVGPRPEIPSITHCYNDLQKQRLKVKPGITGLAQVSGRSLIPHGRKIELDLQYIQNQSLLLDLKIISLTFLAVLTTKGAF